MFLKEFNKDERRAFANLIYMFAEVDKVIARNEKKLIKEYLGELEIKESDFSKMTYTEVMYILKDSSERIKKIVYFELIGLALVDGNYGPEEVDYLDKVALDLGITRFLKIAFANFFYEFKNMSKMSVIKTESKDTEELEKKAEKLFA